MTGRHAQTRRRVLSGLAAAGLAWAAFAATPAASEPPKPTLSSPTPTASTSTGPTLPVAVQLADLVPLSPQPGDVLRLTGTLRNTSTQPVTDLALQLRYDPTHIGSRSQFDDYVDQHNGGPLPLPDAVAATATLATRTLAPGRSIPFLVTAPVDSLSLDLPWEVFELGLQVNGSTTNGFGAVGGLRTVLPWAPMNASGHGSQTQVAWVWPLVDQPHRTVGATFTDDSLAHSLAANGRLGQLLSIGVAAQSQQPVPVSAPKTKKGKAKKAPVVIPVSPVPVTWAVDPLLVEDAGLMSNGYKVATGHGTVTGAGAAVARGWLTQLRSATSASSLLALPYADPDVVAAGRADLSSEVQVATNSGQTLVSQALGVSPLSYAWPPNGLLDQRTLDTLFRAGVSTVVLDDRALPPVTPPNETPSAHATITARDGNLDAILLDHVLDGAVTAGVDDPARQRLVVQRVLSELLMIQAERPSDQRTIVVAPDRHWAPGPSYASALLSDTGKVPWIHPVDLPAVLGTPESTLARQGLTYPHEARLAELDRGYVDSVDNLRAEADTFASILAPGDPNARAFDDGVLRTLSSSWRGRDVAADHYRSAVSAALEATKSKVRIASAAGSFVTLTSHSGTVPVTVSNELGTPVKVTVKISSQHLQVSGGGRAAQTIPAHRQVAVDVRATARTAGVFPLDVTLLTPTGKTYDATQLFVRSTAYGAVTIAITGGATGVLLIAVIIRLVRRARAARRVATGAA